jgi:hypothetical protein
LAKKEISICKKNVQIENPSPIALKDLAAFSLHLEPAKTFLFSYPKFHDPRSRPARFRLQKENNKI